MSKLTRIDLFKVLAQPLAKRIVQRDVEKWAAAFWETSRGTSTKSQNRQKSFVMMFPPPNITGTLHLGHALTGAVQDALIRQRRMQGYDCVFIPGFDHAGLATQIVVEKMLHKRQGITRHELGRQKFTDLAHEWKENKLTEMRAQLDRLGLDLNHDKEYFTMDKDSSHAVHEAFKNLFNSGLIYRANKPVFWCDSMQTTLSDIEVEQVDGKHRYIRTGEIVERKSLSQWFIDAQVMAQKAVEVVNKGLIEMIPPNYKRSWSSWLLGNGVKDWCISRQSWWGHRIPAYKMNSATDVTENWIVADDLQEAQSIFGGAKDIQQDSDVLDTWFSSSLLPLTVSGWPDNDKFLASCQNQHFPLHIMETGFDILTYWVSKMAMISLALTGKIPFKLVLLHGMICDSDGKKMSKSLGNVIDPLDVMDGSSLSQLQARTIEAHSLGIVEENKLQIILDKQKRLFPRGIPACGADGLRSYLLSHDVHEEVVPIQIDQIDKIRRFTNKIWNIFRFLFSLMEQNAIKLTVWSPKMDVNVLYALELDAEDQQVLRELSKCVDAAHKSYYETYQMQHCFVKLELFMTKHLSQIYIGQVRGVLMSNGASDEVQRRKVEVLMTCLLTSLKILHPFMPHVSEFLFQKLILSIETPKDELVMDSKTTRLLTYEPFPKRSDWAKFDEESPAT